jgi:hypothetical protein
VRKLLNELFDLAQKGDVDALAILLDEQPDRLNARAKPYEWSLLHFAARGGDLATVDLLLRRGLDVNTRADGDNTYAMHWAAAAGHLDVVRRLADAGGDVVGHGDDHGLEVIGWATCWDQCDDEAHRAVADFLVSRGARHHIFSAIAMNLADEIRSRRGSTHPRQQARQRRDWMGRVLPAAGDRRDPQRSFDDRVSGVAQPLATDRYYSTEKRAEICMFTSTGTQSSFVCVNCHWRTASMRALTKS